MSIESAKQASLNTNIKAILEKRAEKEQQIRANKKEKKIQAIAHINEAIDRSKQRGKYYAKVSTSYRRYMRHYEDAGYSINVSPGKHGDRVIIAWIPHLNYESAKESPDLADYIAKLKGKFGVDSCDESPADSPEESTDKYRNTRRACGNCGFKRKRLAPYSYTHKTGPICIKCDRDAFGYPV